MKKRARLLGRLGAIAAVALLAGTVASSASADSFVNAGFETGDTQGWAAVGNVYVANSGAKVGTFFAQLSTDSSGPGVETTLSQTVNLRVGESIGGWVNWIGGDECGYDQGWIDVNGTTVWSNNNCGPDQDTWVQWSYTAPGAGNYTVTAHIENTTDNIANSSLGLDGAGEASKCWNALGTGGCAASPRRAVCTANGFQNVLASQVTDPTSPYYGGAPAAYIQGFGLVCSLTDIVTYGGDPSAYHDAGYKVDEMGTATPPGYTDDEFGAWYEYFAKNA